MKKLLAIFFLLISFAALAVDRDTVTLAWDHSPGTNIAGYRIYYGVGSGIYSNYVSVGYVTNATVTALVPGVRYWFAATALDTSGLESEFSNEVSYTAPIRPGPQPGMRMLSTTIESSTNLVNWNTVTNMALIYVGTTNGTAYYRAVLQLAP